MKYADLLHEKKLLKSQIRTPEYSIAVISNVILHQLKDTLEYTLLQNSVNPEVTIGEYDNLLQESTGQKSPCVVVAWEAMNLFEGIAYKIEGFSDKKYHQLLEKTKNDIDLLFQNLKSSRLVLFNLFSPLPISHLSLQKTAFERLCDSLNAYLQKNAPANMRLIDLTPLYATLSMQNSIDWRYFFSSKAPYTIEFLKAYAEAITPFILASQGRAKKALIFDCDNTLWKGILGEDGFAGIEMSSESKAGVVFENIQYQAAALAKTGVIIGLCSKNNPEDIARVLSEHPNMILRDEFIAIKRINWTDKVTNLKEIAKELNIGLDSMVLIDDSDFEVNHVRSALPDVTVFQVPDKISQYPEAFSSWRRLFLNLSATSEDGQKIKMYKDESLRNEAKAKFEKIEDYLASLNLEIIFHSNDSALTPRLSQLTQKTNQFNLQTQRLTEAEMQARIDNPNFEVLAFEVKDTYGSSGITGLITASLDMATKTAEIENFLMSCRILGRNIEYRIFDQLVEILKSRGIVKLNAQYLKTPKNQQVADFYEKLTFEKIQQTENAKTYSLALSRYQPRDIPYMRVANAKSN
jgi:FkbH-like protein